MSDPPTTQELELSQLAIEREQRAEAETADEPAARKAAARRAQKAAYLREKLEEQERADTEG